MRAGGTLLDISPRGMWVRFVGWNGHAFRKKKSRQPATPADLEPRRRRAHSPYFAGVMIGLFQIVGRAIECELRLVALSHPNSGVSVNCVIPMPRCHRRWDGARRLDSESCLPLSPPSYDTTLKSEITQDPLTLSGSISCNMLKVREPLIAMYSVLRSPTQPSWLCNTAYLHYRRLTSSAERHFVKNIYAVCN